MKYTEFNQRPFEAHRMVFDLIETGSYVLDLGCATGYFAKELQKKACKVVGVDVEKSALKIAKQYCDKVIESDFEKINEVPIPKKSFDYILLLDVLEHLKKGEELLASIHQYLKPGGQLILSTPNIAHLSVRFNLLCGNFDYADLGIMDRTHVHFYTKKTLVDVLIKTNWSIKLLTQTADFGQVPILGRWVRIIPKRIQFQITNLLPTSLGIQWIVKCENY